MNRHNRGNRRGRNQSNRGTLYLCATAVVASPAGVLLVKHNRQDDWSLPGGRVVAAEDPSRRAVLEVAEETGIIIADPVYMGRYAGTVASHEIFLANGEGTPRPNRRELQDAKWWDLRKAARQRYFGDSQAGTSTATNHRVAHPRVRPVGSRGILGTDGFRLNTGRAGAAPGRGVRLSKLRGYRLSEFLRGAGVAGARAFVISVTIGLV